MTPQALIALLLPLAAGLTVALVVWSFRGAILRRIEADVQWLQQTARRMTPQDVHAARWVWTWYAVMFLVLLPGAILMPVPVVWIAVWLALWLVPRWAAQRKWERHRAQIDSQMPAMARKLSTIVGAGVTASEAFLRMADEAPVPVRYEFQTIARQWELGSDLNTCLEETAHRLGLQSVRLFASTIILSNTMGGNLVETLERLAASLGSIAEMRQEVKSATAEGRMNIYGLLIAPFLMLGLDAVMDRKAVVELFTTSLGWCFLLPAIAMTTIGAVWAKMTVKVSV